MGEDISGISTTVSSKADYVCSLSLEASTGHDTHTRPRRSSRRSVVQREVGSSLRLSITEDQGSLHSSRMIDDLTDLRGLVSWPSREVDSNFPVKLC